jgi:hypothetical protein
MASAQKIVCVTKAHHHGHITHVGIADGTRMTVDAVYHQIRNGAVFFTVSSSTNKIALVRTFTCPSCHFDTIRSAPDAVTDNNLDNLRAC